MYQGPSTTGGDLRMALDGVDWKMATTEVEGRNTIALLVFHINYYVRAVNKVLEGGPLDAHDKYSYDMEPVKSEKGWKTLKERAVKDALRYADLVGKMSDEQLKDLMADEKYGNWFQNLLGMQEHSFYHLGQIMLLKKIIENQNKS